MKQVFSALLIVLFLYSACYARQPVDSGCRALPVSLDRGAFGVADLDGRVLNSCNPDQYLIPASILKIATALIALQVLGPDHHFQTEFFVDMEDNLYIRGYGDPFLVTEEVALIMDRLHDMGVAKINGIFIDNGSYALTEQVPGRGSSDNPYDAPVSATAVNFNSVAVRVGPGRQVSSAEELTPTLPLMQDLAKGRHPGKYRLNICPGQCRPEEQSARYVAELVRALQQKIGIAGDGPMGLGNVPASARRVLIHRNTKALSEVLVSFLEYSNNFVANQVYLACGAAKYGYPATWDKARRVGEEVLSRLLGEEVAATVQMREGSGLSRQNRVTARTMLKLLTLFAPHADLLRRQGDIRIKSGSMAGVHNYAGYLPGGRPFVIMENQEANTRDRLLKRLQQLYAEGRQ